LYKNLVKINDTENLMESEPDEADVIMRQRGFVKVSDEEFDRLFLLYQKVIDGSFVCKDINVNVLN
jgi:hypothetical protein